MQIEYSGRPCYQIFLSPQTLEYALFNAHSIISSRHVHQANHSFKEAHENQRFKKFKFGPDEILKKIENQILGILFLVWARLCQLQ